MRFKHFLFVVPLVATTLVGCFSDSSDPEPEPVVVKTEYTTEDVEEILKEFDSSSVNGYTYWYRYYNGGWIDDAEVINFKIYDDGFDATTTVYFDVPTISSLTSDTSETGRYASYIQDDDYYITGVSGVSSDYDYFQYNERNMYHDYDDGLSDLENLYTDVSNAFLDQSTVWPEYSGFTIGDITTTFNDEGNAEISIVASADESYDSYEWDGITYSYLEYYAETAEVVLEVDPTGSTVLSMTFSIVTYDEGKADSTIDEGATYYSYYRVEDISYGSVYTDDITPFEVSDFTADQIVNAPSQVVENLTDGELTEDTVKQILANYDAYMEGVVSSTDESYINEYYPAWNNYDDVGGTTIETTNTAYEGYYLESKSVYTPDNENYAPDTYLITYTATEEGVLVNDNGSTEIIEPEYVTSMDEYFLASPFESYDTVLEAFTFFATYGVSEQLEDGYIDKKTSNLVATKNGDTITIEFEYEVYWEYVYDYEFEYEITIEDNFLKSVNEEEKVENTYNYYTLTKGELTAYPSE